MRFPKVSDEHFLEATSKSLPMLISKEFTSWPAMEKWSLGFFQQVYGQTTIRSTTEKSEIYNPKTIGQFIDRIRDNEAVYLKNIRITEVLKPLLDDLLPLPSYLKKCRSRNLFMPRKMYHPHGIWELFIGGPGSGFPLLHYDIYNLHVLIVQIKGRKEIRLFSPGDSDRMYPKTNIPSHSIIEDAFNPDFNKYPLLRDAIPIDITLNPGEGIFLPAGWWHTTKFNEATISVALNLVNKENWPNFFKDFIKVEKRVGMINGFKQRLRLSLVGLLERY